jgi:hypothetical protein
MRILRRLGVTVALPLLGACSGGLLDVSFPGRIPADKVDDPTLAPTLVNSVIGDLECAYNNYTAGNAAHSDEFESSNSNVPGANWGERTIGASENDYVNGVCGGSALNFGLHTVMHTARFQAEDIFERLSNWTDAQVPNRAKYLATVKTYGAFPYMFFGETYCGIAFDGGAPTTPAASLAIAETRFTEAIALAQTASDNDMLNLARVGLARTKMDLKKWGDAATVAALVTPGYVKMASRGTESDRRYNKIYQNYTTSGYYTVADEYRTMNDPRVLVRDSGRGAFNSVVRLWITDKYLTLGDGIRLASYKEAQLILAEAQAQQNQVAAAQQTVNAYRGLYPGLAPLTFTDQADAIAKILEERRRELSFEGGQRMNDILRYHLPWKGAFGSTKNFNQYTGRPYGATTCWPLPTNETAGA